VTTNNYTPGKPYERWLISAFSANFGDVPQLP
jgi:hypothetical protein